MNISNDYTNYNYMEIMDLDTLEYKIVEWGENKGLLNPKNKLAQLVKLTEESGELAGAILRDNKDLQKDSIGDLVVVLTLLSRQLGTTLQECVYLAYEEIKDRTGKISKDGSFIKDI